MAKSGLELKSINSGILREISINLYKGEVGVVLGSNGAGKTTLLNVISGLKKIESGQIILNGKDITNLSPEKRNISYIFQNLALFPHLTVFENVAFPLFIKKEKNINERVSKILKKLDIENLREKYPLKISGGEKQRVAIARALITNPDLLLMDEPFSSLDFEMRKFIRQEFLKIIKGFGITTLFVTHDPYEAEEMSDKIFRITRGRILKNEECVKNRIPVVHLKKISNSTALVDLGDFSLITPLPEKTAEQYMIEFNSEDVYISSEKPPVPTLNTFPAKVISYKKVEGRVIVNLDISGKRIIGNVPEFMWNEVESKNVCVIIKFRGIKVKEATNECV